MTYVVKAIVNGNSLKNFIEMIVIGIATNSNLSLC